MKGSHNHANSNFTVKPNADGRFDYGACQLAVLMDIGTELQAMNETLSVLKCSNFIAVPRILRRISANTHKKRARRTTKEKQ